MSLAHIESASVKPPRIFWLFMGLVIVLAADGATALVFHTTAQGFNSDFSLLYLAAPAAALLIGIPAWFRFIVKPNRMTIKRGLLVGILSSIAAHPIMWMLFWIPTLFMLQALTPPLFSFPLLEIIFSLIYGGWATTSIGALTGVLLIVLQRTLTRAPTWIP